MVDDTFSPAQVILTEAPLTPKVDREKMTSVMFETFNVPALYIGMTSVFGMYASGRTSGTMVESGYEMTHIVPIYEGHAIRHAIQQLPIGGYDITNHLMNLLNQRHGYSLTNRAEREMVDGIKRKFCYLASNNNDMKLENYKANKNYELPGNDLLCHMSYQPCCCSCISIK
jgi:actin